MATPGKAATVTAPGMGLNAEIAGLGNWLMHGTLPAVDWQVHAELASTNTHAMQQWALAKQAPLALPCVLALSQTAGRGRMGRLWQSAQGASVCWSFVWPCSAAAWPLLPIAVGLGLAWGLNAWAQQGFLDVPACIKWPNDIYLQGAKLAGVLCEVVNETKGLYGPAVVVGIGINRTEQAWKTLPNGATQPTALAAHWCSPHALLEPLALAQALWPSVLQALRLLHREGAAALVEAFAQVDALQGQALTVLEPQGFEPAGTGPAQSWHGVGLGLADDGAYRVAQAGVERLLRSAEVSVRLDTTKHRRWKNNDEL